MRIDVAREWELGTEPATIPVCHLCMAGREFWSYAGLTDTVRAIRFLAETPGTHGPYNITTPNPVRSADVIGKLAVLRVPSGPCGWPWARSPEVLGSLGVLPDRLTEAGFRFTQPELAQVLRDELARG